MRVGNDLTLRFLFYLLSELLTTFGDGVGGVVCWWVGGMENRFVVQFKLRGRGKFKLNNEPFDTKNRLLIVTSYFLTAT